MLPTIVALALWATPVTEIACRSGDVCFATFDLGYDVHLRWQPIRLCGVDAPAPVGKTRAHGLRARDALTERLREGPIWFVPSVGSDGRTLRDKFGRWLGWVWVDQVDLNSWLVRADLAREGIGCPQ